MLLSGQSRELLYLTTLWGRAISVQLTFYGPDFQFGFNGTSPFFLFPCMYLKSCSYDKVAGQLQPNPKPQWNTLEFQGLACVYKHSRPHMHQRFLKYFYPFKNLPLHQYLVQCCFGGSGSYCLLPKPIWYPAISQALPTSEGPDFLAMLWAYLAYKVQNKTCLKMR